MELWGAQAGPSRTGECLPLPATCREQFCEANINITITSRQVARRTGWQPVLPETKGVLQARVAREFCVGQPCSAKDVLVGTNRHWSQKIVGTGCADNVVLVHTIAADSNRTDQDAVAIEREAARENRYAVRKIGDDTVALG